jgi:hypothetical protein
MKLEHTIVSGWVSGEQSPISRLATSLCSETTVNVNTDLDLTP